MRFVLLLLALFLSSPVYANDKPDIAPAPAWVKPVAIPPASDKTKTQPVVLLLVDQQVDLTRGRQTVYSQMVIKIQTPQGLAAGNISLPWRPDTDTLTVHKLLIRRGDQVIDVLASGQTFTVVRRETNLDSATLDGMLTANIQPEGLQVGDIIDFTASVSSSDPVMKNHVEFMASVGEGLAPARTHLRVQWPSDLPLRLRQAGALPPLKPVKAGAITSIEYSADDLKTTVPPKGAPERYRLGRVVELSDYATWGDAGAQLAPLYAKAAILPASGPLTQEVEKIRAASTDPKVRAQAALALVQDRVRYVALMMGTGGLVPADSATTWARRFGDCKAKTALLLAILHALDIQAEPVAANALGGDGTDARLPMIGLFNHVLVRATIAGRVYWLDGTRSGDASLDRLATPDFGWGLPLTAGATLARMSPAPFDKPSMAVAIRIDATNGLTMPAPFHVEMTMRGDAAFGSNQGLNAMTVEDRDRMMREFWRKQYDFVEVKSMAFAYDPKTGEQVLTMDGIATMDWSNGTYETDGTSLGMKVDLTREPGPNADAPFAVDYPSYSSVTEVITLPPGFRGSSSGAAAIVNETIGGIEYKRSASLTGNVFTVTATTRAVAREFAAKDAPAVQAALRDLAERNVSIRRPSSYRPTDAELAASLTTTPTTAAALNLRGHQLLDRGRVEDAIKDFTAALALDPKNALAFANRGIAQVWNNNLAQAEVDLAAAAAIDPRNAVIFRARGLIAERRQKPLEAIAAYTRALEIEPNSLWALMHRAGAYRMADDNEAALKDATAAIKLSPDSAELYLLRANIYRSAGKKDLALAEAAAVVAANPDSAIAYTVAGSIYGTYGQYPDALKAYDRAIALKPEAYIYMTRSRYRARTDYAARLADLNSALKLDPKSVDALAMKADLQVETNDFAGAIATYDAALGIKPDDVSLLVARGVAYTRKGDARLGDKDFDLARGKALTAADLNTICWTKATGGVALDSALRDCDAALAKQPDNAAILDSRAFVLIRLGRNQDAITAYDAALARNSRLAMSLYGRGIARARLGDKAKAAIDMAEATRINPDVKSAFDGFGVATPQ